MKIIEPSIVLVRPQLPENIGMVARAMQNCGFQKLLLVSPQKKWPNIKAINASANAKIILKNATVFNNINEALSSFHYVIATSARKRFLQKPCQNNFSLLFNEIPKNKKIAIVFGPENSGLSNDDLILSDIIFSISLSKANQSLNLSHAVLVMAYKWKEYFEISDNIKLKKNSLSNKKDFCSLMDFLKNELDNNGFLYPEEKSHSMFNNIQSMFLRAELSKREIQTMWGIIRALKYPRNR